MSSNATSGRGDTDLVFRRALPLIDRTLGREYGLASEEAADVERSLYVWFQAFVRRPGTPRSEGQLRPHLIMMACQAAHVYWSGRLSDAPPKNENVRRSLTLGPREVAIEIEKTDSGRSPGSEPGGENFL